jgi:hypothetical protein
VLHPPAVGYGEHTRVLAIAPPPETNTITLAVELFTTGVRVPRGRYSGIMST